MRVLAKAGGNGYVQVGSVSGLENSSKASRELAVRVKSASAYNYLADVFWHYWVLTRGKLLEKTTGYTCPS